MAQVSLEIPGFEVEGPLAEGGFGAVLAARRRSDGREAVVKIARAGQPGARTQLAREAAALRAAGPDLAPELLGQGTTPDGVPFLAEERLRAPSLADAVAQGALEPAALRAAGRALAEALAALHARGVAHGDLKPAHVIVEGARARLLDLGLAAAPGAPARPLPEGSFAGTAAYMSPEACRGAGASATSDVYAAGCILFELATGRPPFTGAPSEVRLAQVSVRPPRPSALAALPPDLERVLLRCLAKAPADRFADGGALRDALLPALDAPPAPRALPGGPAAPAPSRRTVAVLRFRSAADLLAVQRVVEEAGGRLALALPGRHAAVLEPAADENPVRRALAAAAALARAGIAASAVVDLETLLAVDAGPVRRFIGALDRPGAFPEPADPPGVLLTPAAAGAVPELALAPGPRDGLLAATAAHAPPPAAPFVGRGPLADALAAELGAGLAGAGPAVIALTGEAGTGKTRLAAEVVERLAAGGGPGPSVLTLRGREGAGETLRALFAALLPGAAGPAPADGGEALLAPLLPVVAGREAWAPVALALGWIAPAHPALAGAAAAPGALRVATLVAAGELVRARARARPLLIVLDDAHLADPAALDALEYAALAEAGAPLALLAAGRPALLAARPALGERAARARAVTLGPLPPADAAELARRLLAPAESVPAAAVEALVARTGGVPLLLVELVRALRAEGLVFRREPGGAAAVATELLSSVPDLPLAAWLAERELAALSEGLATHARLAALLGEEASRAELAGAVAELDRDAPGAATLDPGWATDRLLERGLLAARGARVAFRSPLLREAIAQGVPPALRGAVHRAAFRHLARHLPPGPERLARLEKHAAGSGRAAEAAGLALSLADELRARHADLEAEAAYGRAAAGLLVGDRRARADALRGRGLVRLRLGRYPEAVLDLGAAAALARELGDAAAEVEALLDEATALDWANAWAAAAERVEEAERRAGPSPGPLVGARLALARGRTWVRAGRLADAAGEVTRAAALAAALGDAGYETRLVALLLAGHLLPGMDRAGEAETALAEVIALASARGDLLHLGAALNNRRNLSVARGDLDRARADLARALRIGRDLGMLGSEYVYRFNLGELEHQAGEPRRAAPHVARAVEIERRHREAAPAPLARLLAARRAAHAGDLALAGALLDEVLAAAALPGGALGPSDRVLADMVRLAVEAAPEPAWRGLRERSRRESVEQEPIEVCELHGLCALRDGRREEGLAALEDALRLTREIPSLGGPRLAAALARARAP